MIKLIIIINNSIKFYIQLNLSCSKLNVELSGKMESLLLVCMETKLMKKGPKSSTVSGITQTLRIGY